MHFATIEKDVVYLGTIITKSSSSLKLLVRVYLLAFVHLGAAEQSLNITWHIITSWAVSVNHNSKIAGGMTTAAVSQEVERVVH